MMERVAGDPYRGQRTHIASVIERNAQRAGPHFGSAGRRMHFIEYHCQILALTRGLAFDVDEVRGVRDRFEHDHESGDRNPQAALALRDHGLIDGCLHGNDYEAGERASRVQSQKGPVAVRLQPHNTAS